MTNVRQDRLYDRASAILDGNAVGLGEPMLWHLALRRHTEAMLALSGRIRPAGKPADPYSQIGLERRAFRLGNERAAQNLAMTHFNKRDLAGYRHWLRRAARAGDEEAALEVRRFETRLPHAAAGDIGRRRPYRRSDGLWSGNRRASKATKWYPPDPFQPRGEQ
ncbi:hypothetical protein [Sphingomonas profundi]|uniref:hypothetical protein n=1 Tax=Alterirhizorhabdus profundi TaxID=2681549 RepID=UPI0012E88CA1|nr:hypothetical protein [Sphingomonas profundi]